MSCGLTTFSWIGKKILVLVGLWIAAGGLCSNLTAQTLTFSNGGGGGDATNVWNVGANWSPAGPPVASSIAVVDMSNFVENYISDGTISTAASVGTLILIGTQSTEYVLRATGAGLIGGHTKTGDSHLF